MIPLRPAGSGGKTNCYIQPLQAERIRLAFAEQEFRFNNKTQSAVTVSIGLAEYVPGED